MSSGAGKGALIFAGVIATLAGAGAWLFWRGNHPDFGYQELIPGGRAAGLSPLDFDPIQLQSGIEVEMEHTDDWRVAQEIAMDHLTEDSDYYIKLETIDPHH